MVVVERETEFKETVVNKSKFLSQAIPCDNLSSLKQKLALLWKEPFGNASHIVYALRTKNEHGIDAYFSDDGEPGGTAGRPMFQALQGSQIGEIGCVVIRYFGGTKLGTGGLARAYAQAVNAGLETLPTREVVERDLYELKVSFAHEAQARVWCDEQGLPVQQAAYDGNGVSLTIGWPRDVELDISGLENRLKTSIELQRT